MSQTAIEPNKPILLTNEDADLFLAYQQNRDKFVILLEAGVFDFPSGTIQINVNNSQFQNVFLNKLAYQRKAHNSSHVPI